MRALIGLVVLGLVGCGGAGTSQLPPAPVAKASGPSSPPPVMPPPAPSPVPLSIVGVWGGGVIFTQPPAPADPGASVTVSEVVLADGRFLVTLIGVVPDGAACEVLITGVVSEDQVAAGAAVPTLETYENQNDKAVCADKGSYAGSIVFDFFSGLSPGNPSDGISNGLYIVVQDSLGIWSVANQQPAALNQEPGVEQTSIDGIFKQ